MKKTYLIVLALLILSELSFSQNTDEKLKEKSLQLQKTENVSSTNIATESFFIDVSNFQNLITNYGQFGDGSTNTSGIWPANSNNSYLYYGGLWIGAQLSSGDIRVSQFHRYHGNTEWEPISNISVDSRFSNQDTYTSYWDNNPSISDHKPLGITVNQKTFAWDGEDYIIHVFKITNNGIYEKLQNVYVGTYFDFDVSTGGGYDISNDDMTGYVKSNRVSFMYDGDNPNIPGDDTGDNGLSSGYIGFSLRGIYPLPKTRNHRSWKRFDDPNSDIERYNLLSNHIFDPDSEIPGDYRVLQSLGPYNLMANESIYITMILGIGESENAISRMINGISLFKFLSNYSELFSEKSNEPTTMSPNNVNLGLNVYPNPFNPSTNIQYGIHTNSNVKLYIFNSIGQKIATLVDGYKMAGIHKVNFHANNLPSGVYIISLRTNNYHKIKKIILLR